MESGDVIRILDAAVPERGTPPEFIRSDNGSEFTARAVQDWIGQRGFKTLYIAPGSPWENPYSESFNSRFRDEFLNRESFGSLLEAKVLGKEHREDYNHRRLHSSLDYQTPAEFAQRCIAAPNHQPNPHHKTNQTSHSKYFKVRGHAIPPMVIISKSHSTLRVECTNHYSRFSYSPI